MTMQAVRDSAGKTHRKTSGVSPARSSTSGGAAALAPPAYGIDFVDSGKAAAASPRGAPVLVTHAAPAVSAATDKPAPVAESFAVAKAAVEAIIDIINDYRGPRDPATGKRIQTQYPQNHPEVPARYQDLLREWFFITRGELQQGGVTISATGPLLQTHLDMALQRTEPLLEVLRSEGDPASVTRLLDRDFYSRVSELRARAVSEEVRESIEDAATARTFNKLDIGLLTDEERLKISAMDAFQLVRVTITTVNRQMAPDARAIAAGAEKTFKWDPLESTCRHASLSIL